MPELIQTAETCLPVPAAAVNIRPATLADIPFMDKLQKLHTKQVGWMPTAQFEGKIKAGHVLIAEESGQRAVGGGQERESSEFPSSAFPATGHLLPATSTPVGYCIGNDQYFKRDDVGIIYQMNVLPGRQRGYIGAALLQAMFDRAAWGCRLFCCWCAQDIAANKFWEAMGFVPLAFRTGSRTKGKKGTPRMHIFWQKRIRRGDVSTPYWYPAQTSSGAIREDRLVLPVPPGTHWSDAKPMMLPGDDAAPMLTDKTEESSTKVRRPRTTTRATPTPAVSGTDIAVHGLRFVDPTPAAPVKVEKPKPQRQPKAKHNPAHVAFARELRDRYLEQYNAGDAGPRGKYETGRQLGDAIRPGEDEARPLLIDRPQRLLPAA